MTVLAGPDPYGLIGMIQTVYCYYFTALACTVPAMLEVLQPFAPVT